MTDLVAALDRKTISSRELVRAALDQAAMVEPKIHSFLELFSDQALERAQLIDHLKDTGKPVGPLAGVPIALKDNICLNFGKTTCASRILENYHSPFTATSARRLMDAGAIILGKTNLDEFAMGSSTESSAFGPTFNPYDLSRVPGGSSGGSAAAVAARIVPAALGSDTGGSIRQPAALCNIVGLKPTYSRVSRYGLVAYASSLDQIGPMTRSVADAALMLQIIAGHDPNDSTSLRETAGKPLDLLSELDQPIPDLTVGIPRTCRNVPGNHAAVNAALEQAAAVLSGQGAKIVDVDLEYLEHAIAAYYIIAPAEASSNLARFDGVRYGRRAQLTPDDDLLALYVKSRSQGFGPEVQRRIMLGTHVLSTGYAERYYQTALKVRRLIKQSYDRIFSGDPAVASRPCDVILMPASPNPAFKVGEKVGDTLALYLEDVYTVGVNLAGLPAISVPGVMAPGAGSDGRDLPIGIQFIAPAFEESRLLRVARMFEKATNFAHICPMNV